MLNESISVDFIHIGNPYFVLADENFMSVYLTSLSISSITPVWSSVSGPINNMTPSVAPFPYTYPFYITSNADTTFILPFQPGQTSSLIFNTTCSTISTTYSLTLKDPPPAFFSYVPQTNTYMQQVDIIHDNVIFIPPNYVDGYASAFEMTISTEIYSKTFIVIIYACSDPNCSVCSEGDLLFDGQGTCE